MQVADLFASLSLKPDQGSWNLGERLMSNVKKGLAALGAYEVVKGVTELFNSVSETAIGAERLGQKIGVSSDKVQELGYAASTAGVSTEELQIGFTKLARGLEEFRTKGTGPAGEALERLKVPMDELKKSSPDEILSVIADKFAKMPDGIEKTASAVEIFGKSGANLIPLLNKGSASIGELMQEADDLGIVIDGKTAKGFEHLEETSLRIHGAMTGLKNTLAVALLPTIQKVAEALFGWVKANREVLANGIGVAVDALVFGFKAIGVGIDLVVEGFHAINDVVQAALGGDTGAQALLLGAAAAIGAALLPVIYSAIAAVISFGIATLVALAPFILIGAAVAAVGYGVLMIVKHWDKVKQALSSVGQWFANVGHSIVNAFDRAWEAIKAAGKAAFDWIVNLPVVKQLIAIYDKFSSPISSDEQASIDDTKEHYGQIGSIATGAYLNPTTAPTGATTVNTTFNITSPNADPKAVADQVKPIVEDHWNAQMRGTHAATGGADQ